MGYETRISKAFEGALKLPLSDNSKYVLFSDCHRGVGTSNDNFLKNQHLYFAALQHYYQNNFTYIELGDGDELWETDPLTGSLKYTAMFFGFCPSSTIKNGCI
mgnify:CR=1 FL=1